MSVGYFSGYTHGDDTKLKGYMVYALLVYWSARTAARCVWDYW